MVTRIHSVSHTRVEICKTSLESFISIQHILIDMLTIAQPLSYLESVLQYLPWTNGDPEAFNCIIERLHHMRRSLKDIWPDIVHEMNQGIFTTEAIHTKSHVLDGPAGCLTMHQVPACGGGGGTNRHTSLSLTCVYRVECLLKDIPENKDTHLFQSGH